MNSQPGKNIEIREVTGKKALKTFIRVPWSIYKDDPNWIPPLLMERKEALSSKHPLFQARNLVCLGRLPGRRTRRSYLRANR